MPENTVLSSWSGGKDGCLAAYRLIKQGYKIKTLLNFISRGSGRGCFHGLEGGLLKLQAELIGLPLLQWPVNADMREYEQEFKAAVNHLRGKDTAGMVFGDIYLLEHQSWVQRVCSELGINAFLPLWNNSAEDLIAEFSAAGFKAVIVSCKADVMGKEFLGRTLDRGLAQELKAKGICPCGEKGEYHTLVVDGPIFSRPLRILRAEPVLKESFWKHWFLDIKEYA